MFGQYKSPVHTNIGPNTEEEELEQISEALERKNKVIDARFQDLRKRFLEAAESKMEDIKQKDNILNEIENIREMYIKIKRENTEFKSQVEILNNKLESKNKLNEHLEEKCANILIEKEDTIIKLKAEIIVIKKRLGNSLKEIEQAAKIKRRLEKQIQELEDKHQRAVNAQANFDDDFKKKAKEVKKATDDFRTYKRETKKLLEENSLLIKEYEIKIKKEMELKQHQVQMLDKQKEDITNDLEILRAENKTLALKEAFNTNKLAQLLIQKNFLVKQIDNNLETMNNEYLKLEEASNQKDFMVSSKKSKKTLQKVHFNSMNNLKYFKEVIDFMDFDIETESTLKGISKDKSHITSLISDIKEEELDKLDDSGIFKEKSQEESKQPEPGRTEDDKDEPKAIGHGFDTSNFQHTPKDLPLPQEERLQTIGDQNELKKNIDFYFSYYSQEVLNSVTSLLLTFYEGIDLELPESILELVQLLKERTDKELATEILSKITDKSKIETILKEEKEKLEKLERQKANLIRQLTDARKTIDKLQKGDANEGEDNSEDISDSISAKSSQNKSIRSEDMVTIERLQKNNDTLESKIKSLKKKLRDEKAQFAALTSKMETLQSEIEDKNLKLKSLKDTLVEKFKNDIVKIYGEGSISLKLGQKEKEIEAKLVKRKEKEIKSVTTKVEQQYKTKLESFKQLFMMEKKKREKEQSLVKEKREHNEKRRWENENKGTFVIAFDNSAENVVSERQTEQLKIAICNTLKISNNFLRLISVSQDGRLENDQGTDIKVYLYEICDDLKQFRVLS